DGSAAGPILCGILAAAAFGFAIYGEQRARRRRTFVLNFASQTLRLDFTTAIRGMPRTMQVPFDQVTDLGVLEQPDGKAALVVDFSPTPDQTLREVLIAHVGVDEIDALDRVFRLLKGAFGLPRPEGDTP